MKKLLLTGLLSIMTTSFVMADEYTFEPVEISTTPTTTSSSTVVSEQENDIQTIKGLSAISEQNSERFQNALLELDSVQVDLRDKLLDYKNQYAELDAQYNKYKTERAAMKKIVKQTEKRINNIDKRKKQIRKDMI
ncbi:hypothetical protein IJS77_00580 [bacterium]|nr:hypothetical protein [bacterium]